MSTSPSGSPAAAAGVPCPSPSAAAPAVAVTLTLHRAAGPAGGDIRGVKGRVGPSPTGDHLLIIETDSSSVYELPLGRRPADRPRSRCADSPARSVGFARARPAVGGEDGVYISDLGSYNGTRVNGERISATQRLQPGDTIAICDVVLLYRRRSPAALCAPSTAT